MPKFTDRSGKTMNSSFLEGFSESFLADLGRLVAAWSHVEFEFDRMLLRDVVMGGKSSGSLSGPHMMTMTRSFKDRIWLYRQHVRGLSISDEHNEWLQLKLSQLVEYHRERNRIVHSLFYASLKDGRIQPDAASVYYQKWMAVEKTQIFVEVTQSQLQDLFHRIHVLFWDLFEISLHPEKYAQRPLPPSP